MKTKKILFYTFVSILGFLFLLRLAQLARNYCSSEAGEKTKEDATAYRGEFAGDTPEYWLRSQKSTAELEQMTYDKVQKTYDGYYQSCTRWHGLFFKFMQ